MQHQQDMYNERVHIMRGPEVAILLKHDTKQRGTMGDETVSASEGVESAAAVT